MAALVAWRRTREQVLNLNFAYVPFRAYLRNRFRRAGNSDTKISSFLGAVFECFYGSVGSGRCEGLEGGAEWT